MFERFSLAPQIGGAQHLGNNSSLVLQANFPNAPPLRDRIATFKTTSRVTDMALLMALLGTGKLSASCSLEAFVA
jgi:hypothetical protein